MTTLIVVFGSLALLATLALGTAFALVAALDRIYSDEP